MSEPAIMTVTLRLPARLMYEGSATKLTARAENGAFGILPNHIDFVTALVPSVLIITTEKGEEQIFGIDEGILVKHDRRIDISVRRAAKSAGLTSLKNTIRESFIDIDDRERIARTALSRLEANIVRSFAELKDHGG